MNEAPPDSTPLRPVAERVSLLDALLLPLTRLGLARTVMESIGTPVDLAAAHLLD